LLTNDFISFLQIDVGSSVSIAIILLFIKIMNQHKIISLETRYG